MGSMGILIRATSAADSAAARHDFFEHAEALGIGQVIAADLDASCIRFFLDAKYRSAWAPTCDTLRLCEKLGMDSAASEADLEREVMLTMLLGPVLFEYPSYAEFAASVRVRMNIVAAARNTVLAFHTSKIERPEQYWTYRDERGFTLRPGKSLIHALRDTTQPGPGADRYAFSCYRATEYVILLGIAQELEARNPELLHRLQRHLESRAIVSRQFHRVFLREYGSVSAPLPLKYFVPGDRLWFRNPDARSSDVAGYEGSWVIYIGSGLFANFWMPDRHYTLESKCIEIYHWRHAVRCNDDGELWIDEEAVEAHVSATMADADEVKKILEKMICPRDSRGVYADGGCMDISREFPRWLCPETTDIELPDEF